MFANFNRIIICTKKHSLEEAVGYVKFVVQSITNRELFHSLQIRFGQCWPYLMWLDPVNFVGLLIPTFLSRKMLIYMKFQWNFAGVKEKMPALLLENDTLLMDENVDVSALCASGDETEENVIQCYLHLKNEEIVYAVHLFIYFFFSGSSNSDELEYDGISTGNGWYSKIFQRYYFRLCECCLQSSVRKRRYINA